MAVTTSHAPAFDSAAYWEDRYRSGKTSGRGSYGILARYKADVINTFVREHDIRSVIEHGCGDGNQAALLKVPSYRGFDVSEKAVELARRRNSWRRGFRFQHLDDVAVPEGGFELALSLDVVFHLVEDTVFDAYMRRLFQSSSRFVVIYSTNLVGGKTAPHVRHRLFLPWIEENMPQWDLKAVLENPYSTESMPKDMRSYAHFHFFALAPCGPETSAALERVQATHSRTAQAVLTGPALYRWWLLWRSRHLGRLLRP
jgi:hypothetical protein